MKLCKDYKHFYRASVYDRAFSRRICLQVFIGRRVFCYTNLVNVQKGFAL